MTTFWLISQATWQTIYMVTTASLIAIAFGIPLGVILAITNKTSILENIIIHKSLSIIVNITRSIPFIILLVALIPLTRWLTGSSIGTTAAIVPLSIGAVPFVARIIESALYEVPRGLIQAGIVMGATPLQIIYKILLPEAMPSIIEGTTVVIVSLVGYSAMAGAVGGGGLGEVAINYGYQRFNLEIMLATIILLIILVQLIQSLGDYWANKLRRRT
jgi:D-methionine transport system permease protein